jgi:hypothetical protein
VTSDITDLLCNPSAGCLIGPARTSIKHRQAMHRRRPACS